jgi:hypothetical protein
MAWWVKVYDRNVTVIISLQKQFVFLKDSEVVDVEIYFALLKQEMTHREEIDRNFRDK